MKQVTPTGGPRCRGRSLRSAPEAAAPVQLAAVRGRPANECWQSDVTHWTLAADAHVEIVNFIDDYSRRVKALVVVATFRQERLRIVQ